jgi:hypothetical protein
MNKTKPKDLSRIRMELFAKKCIHISIRYETKL